jgi:SPP1 gp7 family putative phage head morphogenesis protein
VLELARAIMDADGESYADAIWDSQRLLAEVGWSQGKALLDLTPGFDVVPTATLKRLRASAEGYESKLRAMDQDTLRAVLDAAFSDGASVPETRDLLKTAFAGGVHFIDDAGNAVRTIPTESWATMVARTELSQAANLGMMDLYQSAGIEQIMWVAADSPTTCDDCADLDGQVTNLGEPFPETDVEGPPFHPNCVCTTSPADKDLGDFRGSQEQQDRAARGGYSASEYESKFGYQHPLDERKEEAEV